MERNRRRRRLTFKGRLPHNSPECSRNAFKGRLPRNSPSEAKASGAEDGDRTRYASQVLNTELAQKCGFDPYPDPYREKSGPVDPTTTPRRLSLSPADVTRLIATRSRAGGVATAVARRSHLVTRGGGG